MKVICDIFILIFQPEMVNSMFELASSIHQLKLNDTEIGLFTAIILTTHGKSKSTKYQFLRKIDKN